MCRRAETKGVGRERYEAVVGVGGFVVDGNANSHKTSRLGEEWGIVLVVKREDRHLWEKLPQKSSEHFQTKHLRF
jgi:predicted sugar kinase